MEANLSAQASTEDGMETTEGGISMKAVKADDAEAEDKLWNERVLEQFHWLTESYEYYVPRLNAI